MHVTAHNICLAWCVDLLMSIEHSTDNRMDEIIVDGHTCTVHMYMYLHARKIANDAVEFSQNKKPYSSKCYRWS